MVQVVRQLRTASCPHFASLAQSGRGSLIPAAWASLGVLQMRQAVEVGALPACPCGGSCGCHPCGFSSRSSSTYPLVSVCRFHSLALCLLGQSLLFLFY